MADKPRRESTKVILKEGGGPPPGYKWNGECFDQADNEAREFLDDDQYEHMADQVRELARQDDPTHSDTVDVKPIEEFHEISDKGGILRKLNVRLFFFVYKPSRTIVVLGVIKKESEGQTPVGDRRTMRRRMRLYLEEHSHHS